MFLSHKKSPSQTILEKAISLTLLLALERNTLKHGTLGSFLGYKVSKFWVYQMTIGRHLKQMAIVLI